MAISQEDRTYLERAFGDLTRATIPFPKDLDSRELKDLLHYLGREVPCEIEYRDSEFGMFMIHSRRTNLEGKRVREISARKKKGNISSRITFEAVSSDRGEGTEYYGFYFPQLPGEGDRRFIREANLWNKLKKVVEQYNFEED